MAGITSCRLQTMWICGIVVDVVAVVNQGTHVASETASWMEVERVHGEVHVVMMRSLSSWRGFAHAGEEQK